jgi:hypothetical protein
MASPIQVAVYQSAHQSSSDVIDAQLDVSVPSYVEADRRQRMADLGVSTDNYNAAPRQAQPPLNLPPEVTPQPGRDPPTCAPRQAL